MSGLVRYRRIDTESELNRCDLNFKIFLGAQRFFSIPITIIIFLSFNEQNNKCLCNLSQLNIYIFYDWLSIIFYLLLLISVIKSSPNNRNRYLYCYLQFPILIFRYLLNFQLYGKLNNCNKPYCKNEDNWFAILVIWNVYCLVETSYSFLISLRQYYNLNNRRRTTPIEYEKSFIVFKENNTENCVICLEPLSEISMQLPCNHSFHIDCIATWNKKKSNCPICRKKFKLDDEFKDETDIPLIASEEIEV